MKFIAALVAAVALTVAAAPSARATCDVKTFGAVGDGVANDGPPVQAALNTCGLIVFGDGDVYFPAGTYQMARQGTAYYAVHVPAGTLLRGADAATTVLRMAPNIGTSVRLLYLDPGDLTRIRQVTLDGNKAAQVTPPGDEHQACIFANATRWLTIEGVVARNCPGDGVYLYTNARDTTIRDSTIVDNDRDGIALAQAIDGVLIASNRIGNNRAQQVDSEPVGVTANNVSIVNNIIDNGRSNDYAITVSGSGKDTRSSNWTVTGNVIKGPTFVVWAHHVTFSGNAVINATTKPAVDVYRTSSDVVVDGNALSCTQTSTASVPCVNVVGTGLGHLPERVTISDNAITVAHPLGWGVRAQGVISVSVEGNTMRGPGVASAYGAGVYLRATALDPVPQFRAAVVRGNHISAFGKYGVSISGNYLPSTGERAKMLSLDVSGNTFDDEAAVPTMKVGVNLDDGSHALVQATAIGNTFLGGVATPYAVATMPLYCFGAGCPAAP